MGSIVNGIRKRNGNARIRLRPAATGCYGLLRAATGCYRRLPAATVCHPLNRLPPSEPSATL